MPTPCAKLGAVGRLQAFVDPARADVAADLVANLDHDRQRAAVREQAVDAARLRGKRRVHRLRQRQVGQGDAVLVPAGAGRHRHFGAAVDVVHASHHGHDRVAEEGRGRGHQAGCVQQARAADAAAGQHDERRGQVVRARRRRTRRRRRRGRLQRSRGPPARRSTSRAPAAQASSTSRAPSTWRRTGSRTRSASSRCGTTAGRIILSSLCQAQAEASARRHDAARPSAPPGRPAAAPSAIRRALRQRRRQVDAVRGEHGDRRRGGGGEIDGRAAARRHALHQQRGVAVEEGALARHGGHAAICAKRARAAARRRPVPAPARAGRPAPARAPRWRRRGRCRRRWRRRRAGWAGWAGWTYWLAWPASITQQAPAVKPPGRFFARPSRLFVQFVAIPGRRAQAPFIVRHQAWLRRAIMAYRWGDGQ